MRHRTISAFLGTTILAIAVTALFAGLAHAGDERACGRPPELAATLKQRRT